MEEENKEKGIETELRFKEWLDNHNIPYLYIQQDSETISTALKKHFGAKRPDFMILLPNLGFIFIDIKYKKISKSFNSFPLDSKDTKQFSSLQRKLNLPIWYVLSNEDFGFKTWFWIPVSKVLEEGNPRFTSGKSKEEFFAVPITEFIQISASDSINRLFLNTI